MIKAASVKRIHRTIGSAFFVSMLLLVTKPLYAQVQPAKVIPEFTFYQLNNQPFTQKLLRKDAKLFFVFFDVTCAHCQYEVQLISSHYRDFKNTFFYLVSMDGKIQVQKFMATYAKELSGKENVTVLLDRDRQFLEKFTPAQFPALYIYSAEKKLLKYWDTSANIDQILSIIYIR